MGLGSCAVLALASAFSGGGSPPATDYLAMLGEDDIQGKKSGFLTGNQVFYVGGKFLVQQLFENETIGLNHPMFHDLRSRGTGIASYPGVGTGNDFDGWEFHRATQVAAGSVVTADYTWSRPAPTRMFWRPDKMIVEYELSNPFRQGVAAGWCSNWTEIPKPPTGSNVSFWVNLTEPVCWAHCDADAECNQAVYESSGTGQCWAGANMMTQGPASSRPGCSPPRCADSCYAKGKRIANVTVREEKFISANDVISTTITSDRPVYLEISGRSFASASNAAGKVISLDGRCSIDKANNAVTVTEGGVVAAHVQNDANGNPVFVNGKLMYDGMTGVIMPSRPMVNTSTYTVDPKDIGGGVGGVCGYTFYVAVDSKGTTLSWAMNDHAAAAVAAAKLVQANPAGVLAAKSAKMNGLLNEVVPYFRCSDASVVKLYYYLWSIFLMYFTKGTEGMQTIPHTQTAVNNFLGMHRYDAMFQIMVGAWTNPERHPFYANGNALVWSQLMPYRQKEQLPDNFGTTWASGCYGGEMIVHVQGACKIFEHSGNLTFLNASYTFYRELFWDGIGDMVFGYGYDSAICLGKMATILGHANDVAHWNESVGLATAPAQLRAQWEVDTPNMFGSTANGMGWENIAYAGISFFPRDWVVAMADNWIDNAAEGFNSRVPLARTALKDWAKHPPGVFSVVPDANWFMIRALYLHNVDSLANKFTLDHLTKYNMEWGGIPVAPEGRDSDFKLFGDQYSNFNAGKLLLILEGIGGLKVDTHSDCFTFADNLPGNWTFMEFRVPVVKEAGATTTWVTARAQRGCSGGKVTKTATVDGNPFATLNVQPWSDGFDNSAIVKSSPVGAILNQTAGHADWQLRDADSATVTLTLSTPC